MDLNRRLEELLRAYGPLRVVVFPLSLVSALITVGVLTASSAPFAAAALLEVWALILVTLLLLKLRDTQKASNAKDRIIERYSNRILADPIRPYTLKNFKQTYTYSKNGDAEVEQWLDVINGPEPLSLTRQTLSASEPVEEKTRRKVRFVARRFNAEDNTFGAQYEEVTRKWTTDSELECTIHFITPIPADARFTLYMKWSWPRLSETLLDGGVEEFYWDVPEHMKQGIEVEIIFDQTCQIRRNLNVTKLPGCRPVVQKPFGQGHMIQWRYDSPVPNARAGFTLDTGDAF